MSLKKLGRYELIRVIGKGAMGLVYEGRDPNLERKVAIKTITVENLSEQETADYEVRFRTEARSAARLQHPNIVSVYDSDRDLDMAYLVMELVDGQDLKHHMDSGKRYTLQQTAEIMNDLLSALDYAHRQNIVHRDIKPANLLIEADGRVKLTDFGVARIQDSGDATRTHGTMVGTLKYMAPEQVQGLGADTRSDLFSAAIVLYQLLTGYRPFDGGTDYEVIQKIIAQPLEAPSTFNLHLSPEIDAVVLKALEKTREKRYQTAQDFNTAFQLAVRAASDLTVAPPASVRKSSDSATWTDTVVKGESLLGTGTGSGSGSGASLPASTVTQEVELVYWKEIKDSTDAEEFLAFLSKFPTGIYADLARKRLDRMSAAKVPASIKPPPEPSAPPEPIAPEKKRMGWIPMALGVIVLVGIGVAIGYEKFSGTPAAVPVVQVPAPADPHTTTPKPHPKTAVTPAVSPVTPKVPAETNATKPATAPDPDKECEGRVLLGYLTCIQDQCAKAKFAPHPTCVERRAEEQRGRTSP
jgi:eukaryotic-like serine/threonine-protein kinase